jgi:hypothetical protein
VLIGATTAYSLITVVGAVRHGGDLYHVHVVPLVRLSSESEIGGVGLGGEGSCAGVKEEVRLRH